MWMKPTEVPRLIQLREAVSEVLQERPPFERNISLTVRVHVGESNTRRTGDLDNFITGICDGLMAADPLASLSPHWNSVPHVHPSRTIAILDDSQIVSINAEKIVGDDAPWYSLELRGD